jgi:catechol 2,3-dioxygenase-like lactoylglutathione lyase family enzyme
MATIISSKIRKMSPQLLVADIERSLEFYTEKLGFEIEFRHEDFYAGVIKESFSIHLKSEDPSVGERQNKKHNEHLDIMFSVEDIGVLYEEFSNKSVEITQPLRKMPYGKEFYVADPDGHILGFLEPL